MSLSSFSVLCTTDALCEFPCCCVQCATPLERAVSPFLVFVLFGLVFVRVFIFVGRFRDIKQRTILPVVMWPEDLKLCY